VSPESIRPARFEDYPDISRLVDCAQELFQAFPSRYWPFTAKQVHRLAEQRSDLSVAVRGKTLLGFADLYDIRASESAFVGNLIVAREYRGAGIGECMLRYMLDKIHRGYDIPEARLSVFAENRPALALYTKLGFRIYASERRLNPPKQGVTLLHMRRRLGSV
jgi:ribosomal protein S18 acetylase RimI-like enzyme